MKQPDVPEIIESNAEQSTSEKPLVISAPTSPDLELEVHHGIAADLVEKRFALRVKEPLVIYNTDFCKAYAVTDSLNKDSDTYYGLVFEKNLPVRQNVILRLRRLGLQHLYCPLAVEIIPVSILNEQRFVAIFAKRKGISLRQFLSSNGPCSERFIIEYIINPFNTMLRALGEFRITHGSINLDSITIDENNQIMLDECCSKSCGFSQKALYEPLDRVSAIPIGKGDGNENVDYFALGVLCLALVIGKEPADDMDSELFLESRFTKGSFNTFAGTNKFPSVFDDLFKGLINDKRSECWNYRQISEWVKGKIFNIISPTSHIEASRQITFNDQQYFNCRALTNSLYKNWENARRFLKDESVIKWVDRSVKDTNKATRLREVFKTHQYNFARNMSTEDDLVTSALVILDPDGLIRFKNILTHIECLGLVLAYGMAKGQNDYVHAVVKTLKLKLPDLWASVQPIDQKSSAGKTLSQLERAHALVDEHSFGFGMERVLYEMNPAMPCLSDLLAGEYITELSVLIRNLEEHCKNREDQIMDRSIAAFMTSKMELKNKITTAGLSKFPAVENNNDIQVLALLSMAQRYTKVKRLHNLAAMIEKKLIATIVTMYNSKTIREEILLKIKTYAKSGDLVGIYRVTSDANYLKRNERGFATAVLLYEDLEKRIGQWSNKRNISDIGSRKGLQMSLVISYFLCAIAIIAYAMKP